MPQIRIPDWAVVILALHSISAILTLIFAIRDGFESAILPRWTIMGFITGPIGLVARTRLERSQVGYGQIMQDTLLSLGLEFFATMIMPRFLTF